MKEACPEITRSLNKLADLHVKVALCMRYKKNLILNFKFFPKGLLWRNFEFACGSISLEISILRQQEIAVEKVAKKKIQK